MIRLRRKQRNFLNYVRYHHDKHSPAPCFVPKSMDACSVDVYLEMIEKLESMGYIKVNRTGPHYLQWTVTLPRAFS